VRVTIFDYGAGNLHSLAKAIAMSGAATVIASDVARAVDTDVLVLPGVGAFGHAAERLASSRDVMRDAILNGLPTIGICLGMQLLFDRSEEAPGQGLGVFTGQVTRLNAARVPHIGWNSVDWASDMATLPPKRVYYANSFAARPVDDSIVQAWTTHDGDRFPAIVRGGSAIGMQFHPEKSSAAGVRFLTDVLAECAR
jgi:glutamine amidotransferase